MYLRWWRTRDNRLKEFTFCPFYCLLPLDTTCKRKPLYRRFIGNLRLSKGSIHPLCRRKGIVYFFIQKKSRTPSFDLRRILGFVVYLKRLLVEINEGFQCLLRNPSPDFPVDRYYKPPQLRIRSHLNTTTGDRSQPIPLPKPPSQNRYGKGWKRINYDQETRRTSKKVLRVKDRIMVSLKDHKDCPRNVPVLPSSPVPLRGRCRKKFLPEHRDDGREKLPNGVVVSLWTRPTNGLELK